MKFQLPIWLVAAPCLILAAGLFLRWGAQKRRALLNRVVAPRLHQQLLGSVHFGRRRWKQILLVVALTLLLVALARPLSGFREIQIERPGVDVMIALDVSRSMTAEDAVTNRLAAAKESLQRLLDLPSNDRFGLVTFAGEAFSVSPLTQDHASVARTILAMSPTSVSKPGTDIASAIRLAAKAFETKQEAGKAIIIVTDGEELQGDAVLAAREMAAKGISIFTVGVGTTLGARLPNRAWGKNQFAKNEFGNEVMSRLNERVLQQVAAAGRGYYQHLGPQGEGLQDISQRGFKSIARGTHSRQSKDLREFFQIPLVLALALLFAELLLSERQQPVTVLGIAVRPQPRNRP